MKASERAYRSLVADILDGSLPPGSLMSEVEQSTRLGISRTPFREALSLLYADGLVTKPSGRNVFVSALSLEGIHKLYDVRRSLEELAARLAARHGDAHVFEKLSLRFEAAHEHLQNSKESVDSYYQLNKDFDDAIDATIDNGYLVSALATIRQHSTRARRIARSDLLRLRASAAETKVICDAIVSRNEDVAAYATHLHLHHSLHHVVSTIGTALPA
jgi:DNA-binding GntR family transcriptional regulator